MTKITITMTTPSATPPVGAGGPPSSLPSPRMAGAAAAGAADYNDNPAADIHHQHQQQQQQQHQYQQAHQQHQHQQHQNNNNNHMHQIQQMMMMDNSSAHSTGALSTTSATSSHRRASVSSVAGSLVGGGGGATVGGNSHATATTTNTADSGACGTTGNAGGGGGGGSIGGGGGGGGYGGLPQARRRNPCLDPIEAMEKMDAELMRVANTCPEAAFCRAAQANAASAGGGGGRTPLLNEVHKRSFLHAEGNDVKAATDRLVAYWEARADLFGDDRMLLPMDRSGTLRDEDAAALERGMIQILSSRDEKGRALIYYDPSRHDTKGGYSVESMLRVIWYIMHVAVEDPATREAGFVIIVHPNECTPEQIQRDLIAKGTAIVGSVLPLPWRGFHICHPCPSYNKYFPLVKMLAPSEMKDDIVVHFGTEEHVLECLEKYSLPRDRVPEDLGGSVRVDYDAWLAERKAFEGDAALISAAAVRPPPVVVVAAAAAARDEVMEDAQANPSPRGSSSAKAAVRRGAAAAGGSRPPSRPSTGSPAASASSTSSLAHSLPENATAKSSSNRNKRSASESSVATAGSSPAAAASAASGAGAGAKNKRPGRKGDARMHRAVEVKLGDGETSLVEALQEGGFEFQGLNEKGRPHHEVFDQDGVSLMQRKNQLLRRIRVEKKKRKGEADEKEKEKGGDAVGSV